MATSTVENYLKQIHIEQERTGDGVVSPKQLARAMGVAPGTVTSMMKTLDDLGLVTYEPYAGVQLNGPGRKLAAHVLRRHRLVELFLVRVLGMDWSEVHQDAEVLEHAVSERLLERIDEMLGHPAFDPHGDPIPTAAGQMPEVVQDSLRTCPQGVPLRVARITDQRASFLQLLERHRMKPGESLRVEQRDELAETVQVRPEGAEPLRLGFHAAARILVEPV
jgi:DtxR family transcriptional regulator, Mn-dependent transcriptional regulator